jgi:hypothetical protein
LKTIIKYVGDNIKNRVTLILDIWELETSSTNISTRISNLKEYLQKDLENDEHFFKEVEHLYCQNINMNNVHRREQNLPSKVRLKQINACWLKRIKCLWEMIIECDML